MKYCKFFVKLILVLSFSSWGGVSYGGCYTTLEAAAGRLVPVKLLQKTASGLEKEIAILFAVESGFNPRAVSPVGAVGIGQLMPATAAEQAAELGIEITEESLYIPEVNSKLSVHYFKKLLTKFNGRVMFAYAAYNAGPFRVQQYIKSGRPLPRETKRFLFRIFLFYSQCFTK